MGLIAMLGWYWWSWAFWICKVWVLSYLKSNRTFSYHPWFVWSTFTKYWNVSKIQNSHCRHIWNEMKGGNSRKYTYDGAFGSSGWVLMMLNFLLLISMMSQLPNALSYVYFRLFPPLTSFQICLQCEFWIFDIFQYFVKMLQPHQRW